MAKTTAQAKAEGEIAELIDRLDKLVVENLADDIAGNLYDAATAISGKLKGRKDQAILDAYNAAKQAAEAAGLLSKSKKGGGNKTTKTASDAVAPTVAAVVKFIKDKESIGGASTRSITAAFVKPTEGWETYLKDADVKLKGKGPAGKWLPK